MCSGGPTLTAHHPIRVDGVWRAPEGMGPLVSANGVVFNYVLDSVHVLLVDGFPCVTFGHELTEAGVAHAFYGTQRCELRVVVQGAAPRLYVTRAGFA